MMEDRSAFYGRMGIVEQIKAHQIRARQTSTWSKSARCARQCTSPSGCSVCTASGEGGLSGWQQLTLWLESADAVQSLAASETWSLLAGLLLAVGGPAWNVQGPNEWSPGPGTCTGL